MAYATTSELAARLGEDYTGIYGTRTTEAEADLESAAAEINASAGMRYCVPVGAAESSALLKDWNLTLGEERAAARCTAGAFSEKIRVRAGQVRSMLKGIVNGTLVLPGATGNGRGDGFVTATCEPAFFTRNNLRRF